MATRKITKAPTPARSEHDLSSMTREVDAVTAEQLVASSREPGSAPPHRTEVRDHLAQTIEAPAVPRLVIMDAADALIAEEGFAAVTEKTIAEVAHVGEDIFRAHFSDKTALLRALNERFCAHAIGAINDATRSGIWDQSSPRDVIEVAAQSILDAVNGRSALMKAVLTSGDQEMLEELRRVGARMTSRVTRVIDDMGPRAGHKPNEREIGFVLLLAVSLAHNAILVGEHWSGIPFDREELQQRMSSAIGAYLDSLPG